MPSPIFEFGRFELDVGGYVLRCAGRKVSLQRVPMDLLIRLEVRTFTLPNKWVRFSDSVPTGSKLFAES